MEVKLRPWTMKDLESLLRYADNFNIARNMADVFPHPYTREKGIAFLEMVTSATPPHILAIEVAGEAVGGIGIHPQHDIYRKNAEMGYWLAEPYWGKGIMTEAIRQLVGYAFDNWDITRIYARPFGYNLGSQRALEKAGFTLEAKLEKTFYKNGKYLNELIYAVRRPA
jgi:ribosomal-protein-alanine N-acetyltransferase